MEEYIETYGWHFSKKMCEWAVSKMKRKGTQDQLKLQTKENVDNTLRLYGVDATGYVGYDAVYLFHLGISRAYSNSITDDRAAAMYVKDTLEDPDGYDEVAFTRFYADCIGKGEMPEWEDVL